LFGIERLAALIDVANLHRLADLQRAFVRLFLPVIIRNRVVLPAPVRRPMTPTIRRAAA